MPSSRKRPDSPPTFFIDRGLGRRHVADAIRGVGFDVVVMADIFPDDGQTVGDDEWIEVVSNRAWVALTKDAEIVRAHKAALERSAIRMFALPNANLTGPEMAERFLRNIHRIVQRATKPGPFVDIVSTRSASNVDGPRPVVCSSPVRRLVTPAHSGAAA